MNDVFPVPSNPLDALFEPRSVVIGATEAVGSVGRAVIENLGDSPEPFADRSEADHGAGPAVLRAHRRSPEVPDMGGHRDSGAQCPRD